MKKARGVRRHFRRFAHGKLHPEPLSFQRRHQNHYDYAKLGLGPWLSTSFASLPPVGFRREAFQLLLATHAQWQQELTANPDPYYLAIWLMESCFRDSQVVAAIEQRIGHYERVFELPDPTAPPLPPEYEAVPGAELLHWTAYHHAVPHTFDAATASPQEQQEWAAFLRRVQYRTVPNAECGTVYLISTGRVWVGRSRELAV
ncbi:hypothetical protein [Hymenobacter koreensis]|uniref:Uncharacterized protein n=1 Tax=Hymenobacter koreensis TaxID=1084523 RepID=A0ABP8J9K0_9BACT